MSETTVPTIDLDKARELLAAAVKTKGRNFVYKRPGAGWGCDYFPRPDILPEDDPRRTTGCLVGVALGLHGIDVKGLFGSVGLLHDKGEVDLTGAAARYFQVAQTLQDGGETWGSAYDHAEDLAMTGRLDEADLT